MDLEWVYGGKAFHYLAREHDRGVVYTCSFPLRHLFYPAFTKQTLPIQPKNTGAGPTIFIHLNIPLTNTFQADSNSLLSQHSPKFSKPPSADLPAPCDRHLGNHKA